MPVAPARHAGSRAHTLVSAHTFGVGVFRVFACGRALLGLTVGVFARGWLGLVFALLPVFAWGVCALACVRSPGGWDSSVSPPLPLFGWCSRARVGVVGVCASRWAASKGGGTWLSRPPYSVVACPLVGKRGRENSEGGVLARSGEHTSLLCSPTWKRVATLLVLNREGGEPPAGRSGLAGGGVSILVVTLLPLGAWVMLGAWRFPFGGGLGVVVAIYVGSVGG